MAATTTPTAQTPLAEAERLVTELLRRAPVSHQPIRGGWYRSPDVAVTVSTRELRALLGAIRAASTPAAR